MSLIHSTAIIDPAAEIDSTVEIGPYAIIEGPVKIGAGTKIGPHAHISGNTIIGNDNEIHMGVVLGHTPQHKAYKISTSGLVIGDRNVIREYASIHRAYHADQFTRLGNDNYLMGFSHIAHDCTVGNNIVLANGALVAGHVHIDDNANISGNVAVHQFVRIGKFAMIGGLSRVSKDVPPYMLIEGNSLVRGLNTVGLRRNGFDLEARTKVKEAYKILYRSGLNVPQAVERLEAEYADAPAVVALVDFIRKSVRGISKHAEIHSRLSNTEDEE